LSRAKPPKECDGYPYPMIPTDVLPGEEVDFYLPTCYGESLACSLYRSLGSNTNREVEEMDFTIDSAKPVIIVCHGYMSWRNQMLLAHLAHRLHKRLHCHALRFDFTGNGHSTGTFRHSNYYGEFRDLQTVLSFVRDQMKCRVVCIVGHSKGAATVLRAAAEQETYESSSRIPCFVNISGRFAVPHEYDVGKLLGADKAREFKQSGSVLLGKKGDREFIITAEDVAERSQLDSSFVKQINNANVLTIHGSRDEHVDVGNALEFAKAITNHELLIIDGADHNYNGLRYIPMMVDCVVKFVDKNNIFSKFNES
jgi:uncharacterized protein